jgi:glycyl-tRNA synthetase beta chain
VPDLVRQAVALLEPKRQREAQVVCDEVVEFIRLRFANALVGQGQLPDVVDAVLSASFDEPLDALARIRALTELKQQADFEPLAVAFKRVGNIIKDGTQQAVDPQLLTAACEKELYAAVCQVETQLATEVAQGRYDQALAAIAGLRAPIDSFFDGVMVMVEDEAVKSNRLAMLTKIAGLYQGIADFSRIA